MPIIDQPIARIVAQHVEEAAHLRHIRSAQVRAPDLRLPQLARLDERVAAHLDGIAVAGECGIELCQQALERTGKGEAFVAAVRATEDRDAMRLEMLMSLAGRSPAARVGVVSAFGWVSATDLRGITKAMLDSTSPSRREIGLTACELHRVDPRSALDASLRDAEAGVRARGLRVAGCCGRVDLLAECLDGLGDNDTRCAFEAARSAMWLGDRGDAVDALEAWAMQGSPVAPAALRYALMVLPALRVQPLLSCIAGQPASSRRLIEGIGLSGDPRYLEWLMAQMGDDRLARLAGDAFVLITGLGLTALQLNRARPPQVQLGPTDEPDDDNVAMDEDASLPWPDPVKVAAWWRVHSHRFTSGVRYFMGEPPTPAHCLHVLTAGFQRQRTVAAQYLCLLSPGTPLFNTHAPAWRQRRLLASMTGA